MRMLRWSTTMVAALFIVGCAGEPGPAGPEGAGGPAGVQGEPGVKGDPGDSGENGDKGDKGEQGEQGETGPTGPAAAWPPGAGLKFEVISAALPASGAPSVTFSATDARGNPIDLIAEIEAGTMGPRYVIAARDATGAYTSLYASTVAGKSYYENGAQQPSVLPSAIQASNQPPRTLSTAQIVALYEEISPGVYTFNFPTAPAAAPTLTNVHTVAFWATRTFEGKAYPASVSYDFVPSTGVASAQREIVTDAACNTCHQNLQAHDSRRTVGLCVTCHNAGTTDPETGNSMDFKVLVHSIHRGEQSGDPAANPWEYKVVGYGQSVHDYSHVAFAPPRNSVTNCTMCHQGADADRFKTTANRAACGSCHYDVDFATGQGHSPVNLAQANDNLCSNCHVGADVEKVHSRNYDPVNNVLFDGRKLEIKIDDATGIAAGQAGTVTFTVKVNGQPHDVKTTPLSTLRFTVAGGMGGFSGPGAPAPVGYINGTNYTNATALAAVTATGTPGQFTAPLPVLAATASGTLAIGVEAAITESKTDATNTVRTKSYPVVSSSVIYRGVDGVMPQPRKQITTAAKCDNCHVDLGFHGSQSRKDPNYCAFCHNPNNVNDERVSRFETDPETGATWETVPGSVQLSVMIHKIHAGGALTNPSTLGANPSPNATNPAGVQHTFAGMFPGDLGNCQTCHASGTYGLPASTNIPTKVETWMCTEDPSLDTNAFCNNWVADASRTEFIPAQKSACTSCHDSPASGAHADSMTIGGIETCDVCHGPGRTWDPLVVHQPSP